MSTLSDMLVFLRKRKGLSQQELADLLGLNRSAIGMYETGKREPNLETLEIFADFYNVDMNTLTGGKDGKVGEISFDDFTYALQNEVKTLTDMDKQILLSMAKQLNDARMKKDEGTD